MPSDDFGIGYVLKEVVDSVRRIEASLPTFVSRAELELKLTELDKRYEAGLKRLEDAMNQGPIKPWVVSGVAVIIAIASIIVNHH